MDGEEKGESLLMRQPDEEFDSTNAKSRVRLRSVILIHFHFVLRVVTLSWFVMARDARQWNKNFQTADRK